jgi:hypothetical protein
MQSRTSDATSFVSAGHFLAGLSDFPSPFPKFRHLYGERITGIRPAIGKRDPGDYFFRADL